MYLCSLLDIRSVYFCNLVQFSTNTQWNTAKTQSKTCQKHKVKYVKNTKWILWFQKNVSSLQDNDRLFQAKYLTYLPSVEQLKQEIEQQKLIFQLQQETE